VIKVSPSMLCADFSRLGQEATDLVAAGADWLHFDCMDGHFVDNLTFGPVLIKGLREITNAVFDVHLMIGNPAEQIDKYAEAGADQILFHIEVDPRPVRLLNHIRSLGKKSGIVYNPATPLQCLETVLPAADLVLIMSVEPGAAGQQFMPIALRKIEMLREFIDAEGLTTEILVDGGVNTETGPLVVQAGVDAIISGSWLFTHPQGYAGGVSYLKSLHRT